MNLTLPALFLATLGVGALGPIEPQASHGFPAIVKIGGEGVGASVGLPARRNARAAVASAPRPSPTRALRADRPVDHILTGTASWFCVPGRSACTHGFPASGLYAAAGPALRAALGDWRGRVVRVSTGRASVNVRLIDWCQCYGSRVIDLYASVWGGLGVPLSAGLVDLDVSF